MTEHEKRLTFSDSCLTLFKSKGDRHMADDNCIACNTHLSHTGECPNLACTPRDIAAAYANDAAADSRIPGAPTLSSSSTLSDLRAWLQWNDANGCYEDDPEFGAFTLDVAWDCLFRAVEVEA